MAVGFFDKLKKANREIESIPDKVMKCLGDYLEKKKDITSADVKKNSVAGQSLYIWCRAMYDYSIVMKKINPLK